MRFLEEGVIGKILKFADDTKVFRKTKEIGDKQKLQDDIDELVRWSEKLQMLFNFGKCKCLHTGPVHTGKNYEMEGTIYTITILMCVCLSQLAHCRSQFLFDRLGRCHKRFVSTESTSYHEFAAHFGKAIFFICEKHPKSIANSESRAQLFT